MIDIDLIARRELTRRARRDQALATGRGRPQMLMLNHLAGFGAGGSDYVKTPTVASLCHFNGSDAATTTTDSAQGTVTLSGTGVAYLTTGGKQFGSAGLRFDVDAAQWGRANWSARADFIFPSDFTVEFWARQITSYIYSQYGYLMSADGDDNLFQIDSDQGTGALNVRHNAWGGSGGGSVALTLSSSAFRHCAIVRLDGTVTCYQDGVGQGSFASAGTLNPSGLGFRVGGVNINNLWAGYFDEFRVYKDSAAYTTDFTPPSAEF